MAHDRCSKCGGSAYKVCSGCYDRLVLQKDEIVKALDCHPAYVIETIKALRESHDKPCKDIENQLANANRLLKESNRVVESMKNVVETARRLVKTERWPYLLGGGHLAHAIDALEKSEQQNCAVKSQAGFPCSLHSGHEGAHQMVVGWNS